MLSAGSMLLWGTFLSLNDKTAQTHHLDKLGACGAVNVTLNYWHQKSGGGSKQPQQSTMNPQLGARERGVANAFA